MDTHYTGTGYFLYVYDQGAVSAERILDVMRGYRRARVPLGKLALELKLLNVRHIWNILKAQANLAEPLRFGEVAVSLGFLDEAQIRTLLQLQAKRVPGAAEFIVKCGFLTRSDADRYYAAFRAKNLS
jgi:hypothetical protein